MLATACYDCCNLQDKEINFYSISGDRGKSVGFVGNYYRNLAPKISFWKIWHSNIGIIPASENNHYYITEYYKQVLSSLNAKSIYEELDSSTTILLCYEPHNLFCHRHIVSAWLELIIGITIPEVIQQKTGKLKIVNRPTWIKENLARIID